MKQSFSVSCTTVGGKLKLFDREGFDRGLTQFVDGQVLTLTLEDETEQRTSAQNRFFHGPVLKAFKELGWPKQEAKDMLCLRFIPQEIRQLDGSIAIVPGHTSALSKPEFNELIEECIQLAAENGEIVQDGADWLSSQRQRVRQEASAHV